jgi:hypothetical protein
MERFSFIEIFYMVLGGIAFAGFVLFILLLVVFF